MTFVKTKPKEEGIGIFDFAVLAIYKIGFPFFFFSLRNVGFFGFGFRCSLWIFRFSAFGFPFC